MKPEKRFVLDSVTGWHIARDSAGSTQWARVIWVVLDSAICYRSMGEYIGQRAELRARELAHRLNSEHEAYMESLA